MDWLGQVTISAIVSSIISIGLFSVVLSKLKSGLAVKNNGIKKVYKYGKNIRAIEKAIENAKEVSQLAYNSHGFIENYKSILKKSMDNGCMYRFLMGNPKSIHLTGASSIVTGYDNHFADKVNLSVDLLKSMRETSSSARECVEVKFYNVKICNPVTIIKDKNDKVKAFLTILMPPKISRDCMMLEFEGEDCDDIVSYFNHIWSRIDNEIIYKK